MVGDIFFIAVNVPIDHALSWWNDSPPPLPDPPYQDEPEAESVGHEPIYSSSEATPADAPPETNTNAAIVHNMFERSQASRSSLRTDPIDGETVSDQDSISENANASSTEDEETHINSSPESIAALGSASSVPPAPSSPYPYPTSLIHRPARRTPGIAKPNKAKEGNGHSRSPQPHEPPVYRWQLNQAVSAPSSHEIWHPPPSAYEGKQAVLPHNRPEAQSRLSNPLSQRSASMDDDRTPTRVNPGPETLEVDEWRLYAPFPSAYPPTPLPAVPANLAPSANVHTSHRYSDKLPPFAEEGQQGFARSLQPPRKPSNPGSDGSLSDGKLSMMGVQESSDDDDDGESMNVDSEDDSENEFNVTLRTPKRKRITNLPANRRPQAQQQMKKMASRSSVSSHGSTTLSTHANASTLRTSSSGSSLSISDDSSAVGHKRPFPETPVTKTRSATASKRSKPSAPTQFPRTRQTSFSTSDTAAENEPLFAKTDELPKKTQEGVGPGGPITKVPSVDGQPPVPPKEERPQARADGGATRGRGRGRGNVTSSRSSARLAANSKTVPQSFRPPVPQPANPPQTNSKSNKSAPASLRDTTVRNRS